MLFGGENAFFIFFLKLSMPKRKESKERNLKGKDKEGVGRKSL